MNSTLGKKIANRFVKLENKLPLEKFIPSAFIIFLLCIFILSVITYNNVGRYKSDIEWVIHSNDVIKKLNDVYINNIVLSSINRGYAITKDKVYLARYDSLKQATLNEVNSLKALTLDNNYYTHLLDSLESLSIQNMRINEIREDHSMDEQIEITNNGRIVLRKINSIIQEIKSQEVSLLSGRKDIASRSNTSIQFFIIITSLFTFAVIGLSLFVSNRLIKNKSKAEELLLKSYDELEDTVDERTLELKESNEKLSTEIVVRKKTEITLRESEQRFRMMADSAPVLIWISDVNKLYTYLNKAWLEFTGRTMEQELGNGWTKGVHPEDLKKCMNAYIESFENRVPFEVEYRLRNAEGNYKWIFNKGVPRYEGETFVGYIGSCTDIDERKKNEKFLKIQYDISRTLAESDSLEEASKKLLKNICNGIDWDFGIIWIADPKNEYIKADYLWSEQENDTIEYSKLFDDATKFSKGVGFTGTIFKEGKSMWTKNIADEKYFLRKEAAFKMGWNSALGIPISNGKDVIAIIECFNKKSIEEKREMIEVLESAGRQIGNFIERKKAEENLRVSYLELEEKVKERTKELANTLSKLVKESEEKEIIQNKIKLFSHAIRSINDCVFITDLEYKTIFINKAFESVYGYNQNELSGNEIPVLSDANITLNLKEDIRSRTLKEGWKGELITHKKNGTGFSTYMSTSSVRNDEGKADAIVGICQDITELKNTQEMVKKRNNLLILLNDVIRFTNKSLDFNEAVLYSINKVCEYTHWDIGHCFLLKDDDLVSSSIWNEDLDEVFFTFQKHTEQPKLLKASDIPGNTFQKGTASWLDINTETDVKHFKRSKITKELDIKTGIWVPIKIYDKSIGLLEFFKRDREQPDQELLDCIYNIGLELGRHFEKLKDIDQIRQSEKLLMDAQHIAKLGSWKWDLEKDEITWSEEMYQIFGLDKDGEKITFEKFLSLIHPDDVENSKSLIKDAIENKRSFSYYHRIIIPSGFIKTIKAHGEINFDENENVTGMFGTGHDVTEIRQAEEELRKTNLKLIETQKELIYNEKLAALGRFSSGIAHEIRNPLANISSLAQLISKAVIDEKNKRRLNYIISNVEIANKIIQNLLSYASPEDLNFTYVNIRDVLSGILASVEARCVTNNIKIEREIQMYLPDLYLDQLKLENAFMNFISNSIEAMYDGGVLTVKATEDTITNEIIVEFKDTGVGIPSENLDKIIEPFFTTKDDGVGLGMGLAYQTIRLHNGTFKLQSVENKGTQINIRLPIGKLNNS